MDTYFRRNLIFHERQNVCNWLKLWPWLICFLRYPHMDEFLNFIPFVSLLLSLCPSLCLGRSLQRESSLNDNQYARSYPLSLENQAKWIITLINPRFCLNYWHFNEGSKIDRTLEMNPFCNSVWHLHAILIVFLISHDPSLPPGPLTEVKWGT